MKLFNQLPLAMCSGPKVTRQRQHRRCRRQKMHLGMLARETMRAQFAKEGLSRGLLGSLSLRRHSVSWAWLTVPSELPPAAVAYATFPRRNPLLVPRFHPPLRWLIRTWESCLWVWRPPAASRKDPRSPRQPVTTALATKCLRGLTHTLVAFDKHTIITIIRILYARQRGERMNLQSVAQRRSSIQDVADKENTLYGHDAGEPEGVNRATASVCGASGGRTSGLAGCTASELSERAPSMPAMSSSSTFPGGDAVLEGRGAFFINPKAPPSRISGIA